MVDQGDRPPAGWLTMREAAPLLGLTADAIRQRVRRKTIPAAKFGGVWHVQPPLVVAGDATDPDDPGQRPSGPRPSPIGRDRDGFDPAGIAAPGPIPPALAVIRDEWVMPLVRQNEALAIRLGTAEAERDQARAEADRLRADLATMAAKMPPEAPRKPQDAPIGPTPIPGPSKAKTRPWWRRLFGGERGAG